LADKTKPKHQGGSKVTPILKPVGSLELSRLSIDLRLVNQLIAEIKFDLELISPDFSFANLPMINVIDQGSRVILHQACSGRSMTTTHEWLKALADLNQRFIHPLRVLDLAKERRDEPWSFQMFTTWQDRKGRYWHLRAFEIMKQKRLQIEPSGPNANWLDSCCLGATVNL
jgi:hypothetical protein